MHDSDATTLNLLIADDHPAIQKALGYLMEAWGYDADIVCNGLEAVEHARSGTYNLCLMDRSMPVMDGFATVETIRKQMPYFPILMHSSDPPPPDSFLAEKGVDEWIDKACGPEHLHQRITEWGDTRTFSVVKHGNQIAVERKMPMDAQHAQELRELRQKGLTKLCIYGCGGRFTFVVHERIQNKISRDLIANKQDISEFLDRSEDKPSLCHLYKGTFTVNSAYLLSDEFDTHKTNEDSVLKECETAVLKAPDS